MSDFEVVVNAHTPTDGGMVYAVDLRLSATSREGLLEAFNRAVASPAMVTVLPPGVRLFQLETNTGEAEGEQVSSPADQACQVALNHMSTALLSGEKVRLNWVLSRRYRI